MPQADAIIKLVDAIKDIGTFGGVFVGLLLAFVIAKEIRAWTAPKHRKRMLRESDAELLNTLKDMRTYIQDRVDKDSVVMDGILTAQRRMTADQEKSVKILEKMTDRQIEHSRSLDRITDRLERSA